MITAKFIGGYMDGEIMAIPQAYPQYFFHRFRPPKVSMTLESGADRVIPWREDYELDEQRGEVVFYRHSKCSISIRRYYV